MGCKYSITEIMNHFSIIIRSEIVYLSWKQCINLHFSNVSLDSLLIYKNVFPIGLSLLKGFPYSIFDGLLTKKPILQLQNKVFWSLRPDTLPWLFLVNAVKILVLCDAWSCFRKSGAAPEIQQDGCTNSIWSGAYKYSSLSKHFKFFLEFTKAFYYQGCLFGAI